MKEYGTKIPLLIYDNTPNPSWTETDLTPLQEFFNLKYISDRSNPGIAKAYNCALDFASQKRISWLLVLDQDTDLPPFFLKNTLDIIEAHGQDSDIVLFVPNVSSHGKYISPSKWSLARIKRLKKPLPAGLYSTKKYTAINSGMVLNVGFMLSIGKYSEKYALDYLDHWLMATLYKQRKRFYLTGFFIDQHLSTLEKVDLERALRRYRNQFFSVLAFYLEFGSVFEYVLAWLFSWIRSFKLSIRYRNLSFIKIPGSFIHRRKKGNPQI
jgi:glycosyltransferase involved in cell wall biosynthesis